MPRHRRSTRATALLVALAALLTIGGPAGADAQPLRLGFADSLFFSGEASVRAEWLHRATTTGGTLIRINVPWSGIAPKTRPPGFDATDPAAAGYRWTTLDEAVREATDDGLEVLFTVYRAPSWAEGEERDEGALAGSWEPSRTAFGEFGEALARRYGGSFPEPADPTRALPAVGYFEAWNEPNLEEYLAPQWSGGENRAANLYRGLVDSFYEGVKKGSPRAQVVAGSLAPFGDEPGESRTRPVLFARNLFCLEGGILRKASCPEPVRFDIFSDHPIAVGAPDQSATSPFDVTTPDLGRLTRILTKAEELGRAVPPAKKPLWVTEFWYDSSPPDPTGVPLATQARWYEQAMYLFWEQGAEAAIALQLRDQPEGRSWATSYQSGAFLLDGTPKPAATAFRFPFVAHRAGPFKVGVWGIAPHPGKVTVQAYRKGSWKKLGTFAAKGAGIPFTGEVRLLRFAKLRAVLGGGQSSLPWSQR
jgi:hypothetical protein